MQQLLFDIQRINKFLLASEEGSKRTPNTSDDRTNIWSLITAHSQPVIERPAVAPVGENHQSTTFTNATLDDLGNFCRQQFHSEEGKTQTKPAIASDRFSIMDERSLRDDTTVRVRWESWLERINPSLEDDSDEAFQTVRGWAAVRVSFFLAAHAVAAVGPDLRVSDFRNNLRDQDDGVCLRDKSS